MIKFSQQREPMHRKILNLKKNVTAPDCFVQVTFPLPNENQ